MLTRNLLLLFAATLAALAVCVGCGSDGPSKAEQDAYKQHDKNAIHGPPADWKNPAGHSSIAPGGPAPGAGAPGAGAPGAK